MEIRRRRRFKSRGKRKTGFNRAGGFSTRKSVYSRTPEKGGLGGALLPIAVFGVVFYVIAFTSFGDRLTQKAVGLLPDNCAEKHAVATYLPVKTELPEATSYAPLTTEFDSGSSAKAALPRLTLYMLQMGVYSTEENAQEQSERLKKLGAAGYIYNDNGVYRVIASAYLNEEDAQSVKDRLNREGYACTIYKLERSGAELLITTDNQHLASIEKAFDTAGCIVAGVSDISIDFDAEERSVEYASKAVERLRVELAEASASIFGSAQTNELLMYLYNYLNDMNEILGREEAVSDRAAYSSAIKQITVVGALRYASLLQQICN